ncbi:MAG: DNA polymerase IV [Culicoidibacterales bacterium]
MGKIIFHIDMNSYFVACELASQPHLRGLPVVVSGHSRRGVITTASYEARALGIHAAMPLQKALRICPTLIVLPVNHQLYRECSVAMIKILKKYSLLVEQASIDEAYMDMSHLSQCNQSYEYVARIIQADLQRTLQLGSSVGISYNRFLAKMASDMQKPNGLTILRRSDIATKIWPLPISEMYGVGPKTSEKLRALGIESIGDLAHYKEEQAVKELLGDKQASSLRMRACGNDFTPVVSSTKDELDSIGHSKTLLNDTLNEHDLEKLLIQLVHLVEQRRKKHGVVAKTIQIMIRNHMFETITRSITLDSYIKGETRILYYVTQLFWEHWDGTAVRLLGVTIQNLRRQSTVYEQLRLF